MKTNSIIRNLFLTMVGIILITPNLVMILKLEGESEFSKQWISNSPPQWSDYKSENPILHLIEFKKSWERYYSENFGLKEIMFRTYSDFKYHYLNESALPNSVIVGSNGWLFLGNKFAEVIDKHTRIKRPSDETLRQISKKIVDTREWLSSMNIDFFVVVAPNKHSIYGNHLNLNINNVPSYAQTIIQHVRNTTGFEILDLTQYLLERKKAERLYHKTDTHWNGLGAFWGYQEIIKLIRTKHPEVVALKRTSFKPDNQTVYIQDLGRILRLKLREKRLGLALKDPSTAIEMPKELDIPETYQYKPVHYERRFINESKPKKILIFRDSFCSAMVKYLKETFGSTLIVWQHRFSKSLVLKEKPDIVLFEYVEKDIDLLEEM